MKMCIATKHDQNMYITSCHKMPPPNTTYEEEIKKQPLCNTNAFPVL